MAHPIKAELKRRDISIAALSRAIGIGYNHTVQVVNGSMPASRPFKHACALFLRMPVSDLFHDESREVAV